MSNTKYKYKYEVDLKVLYKKSIIFRLYDYFRKESILKILKTLEINNIVDYGSNTGHLTKYLYENLSNTQFHAYEPNKVHFDKINFGSANIKKYRDFKKLPKNNKSSLILVSNVLEYVNDLNEYSDQIKQLTALNSFVCVVYNWEYSPLAFSPFLRSFLSKRSVNAIKENEPNKHLKKSEILKIHKNIGCELLSLKYDLTFTNQIFLFKKN
tara:strand:- start:25 stop:657 length:633 start_codon:yes stop_codon:yes gene_type:complete